MVLPNIHLLGLVLLPSTFMLLIWRNVMIQSKGNMKSLVHLEQSIPFSFKLCVWISALFSATVVPYTNTAYFLKSGHTTPLGHLVSAVSAAGSAMLLLCLSNRRFVAEASIHAWKIYQMPNSKQEWESFHKESIITQALKWIRAYAFVIMYCPPVHHNRHAKPHVHKNVLFKSTSELLLTQALFPAILMLAAKADLLQERVSPWNIGRLVATPFKPLPHFQVLSFNDSWFVWSTYALFGLVLSIQLNASLNLFNLAFDYFLFRTTSVDSPDTYLDFHPFRQPIMRAPWFSSSIHEFWTVRWNHLVQSWLVRSVYLPLRSKHYSKQLCAVATFMGSAFVHQVMVYGLEGSIFVPMEQLCYFLLQGILVVVESALIGKIIHWHASQWIMTMMIMIATSPLFSNPFLRVNMVQTASVVAYFLYQS